MVPPEEQPLGQIHDTKRNAENQPRRPPMSKRPRALVENGTASNGFGLPLASWQCSCCGAAYDGVYRPRPGPSGPATLCNPCGTAYASYRPDQWERYVERKRKSNENRAEKHRGKSTGGNDQASNSWVLEVLGPGTAVLEFADGMKVSASRPPEVLETEESDTPKETPRWEAPWQRIVRLSLSSVGNESDGSKLATFPGKVGSGEALPVCAVCNEAEDSRSLLCDDCGKSFHTHCLSARDQHDRLEDDWFCPKCLEEHTKQLESLSPQVPASSAHFSPRSAFSQGSVNRWQLPILKARCSRVGKLYQALVPDYSSEHQESDGSGEAAPVLGDEVLREMQEARAVEEQFASGQVELLNGWQPASTVPIAAPQKWFQCQQEIAKKGSGKRNVFCRKWRRAPFWAKSGENWECNDAVLWDPSHADCAVPQEVSFEELQQRHFATQMATTPALVQASDVDDEWHQMFSKLERFRNQTSHTAVPLDTELGMWIQKQRKLYRRGNLDPTRTTRLAQAGLSFDVQDIEWEDHFALLCAFKHKYGHCNVSEADGESKLLTWVEEQRLLASQGRVGRRFSTRLQRLRDIGAV